MLEREGDTCVIERGRCPEDETCAFKENDTLYPRERMTL
jgi:hypothetical protein